MENQKNNTNKYASRGNFRVKFFGCFARESTFAVPNCDAKTIDSYDMENYRHFAVDKDHNVLYFCDRNPYLSGMFCYSSDLNNSPGTWRGQWSEVDIDTDRRKYQYLRAARARDPSLNLTEQEKYSD